MYILYNNPKFCTTNKLKLHILYRFQREKYELSINTRIFCRMPNSLQDEILAQL